MATVYKRGGKTNRKGAYFIAFTDHTGKRVTRSSKTTDHATAKRIASKLEADAALRREGVIDPDVEARKAAQETTLREHLSSFRSTLNSAGRSERHVGDTVGAVNEVAAFGGIKVVGEITADVVNRFVESLVEQGRSKRTIQKRLIAIKQFSRWLVRTGRLPSDPLASVSKPNPERGRRYRRRMLLVQEWDRLRETTMHENQERGGMPAGERVLLYAFAVQTGLRSSEISSLRRDNLYLDGPEPYVTCDAGSTKNKTKARQYVQPELASEIQKWLGNIAADAPVFKMPPSNTVAAMLRGDLAAARAAWLQEVGEDPDEHQRREQSDFLMPTNHHGKVLDFHSLRHTCGAWLAMTGAHPNAVKAVMRHSSIVLTMDTYGHLFPGQEAETIARLPPMLSTDGSGSEGLQRKLQRTGRNPAHSDATRCNPEDEGHCEEIPTNPAQNAKSPGNSRSCIQQALPVQPGHPVPRNPANTAEIQEGTAQTTAPAADSANLAVIQEAWERLPPDVQLAVLRAAGLVPDKQDAEDV